MDGDRFYFIGIDLFFCIRAVADKQWFHIRFRSLQYLNTGKDAHCSRRVGLIYLFGLSRNQCFPD